MIFIHDRTNPEYCATYTVDNEREALGYIISLAIPQIKYMSIEAMKQWILDACEYCLEVEQEGPARLGTGLTRKTNAIKKYLDSTEFTQEKMMQTLVNLAMGGIGLGTLPGFRHSGIPASYNINPELVSQYEISRTKR